MKAKYIAYSLLICACGSSNRNSPTDLVERRIVGSHQILDLDYDDVNFVISVLNYGIDGNMIDQLSSQNVDVKYESQVYHKGASTVYSFLLSGHHVIFREEFTGANADSSSGISVMVDGTLLPELQINHSPFVLSELELTVDYRNSHYYTVMNRPNLLLVKSYSANWVGRMTRFSFFQVIDFTNICVYSFVGPLRDQAFKDD